MKFGGKSGRDPQKNGLVLVQIKMWIQEFKGLIKGAFLLKSNEQMHMNDGEHTVHILHDCPSRSSDRWKIF